MHISLICVGMRLPAWINQGVTEYQKRFPPELKVGLIEIPASKRTRSAAPEKILKTEAERIRKAIPKACYLIALDEHGKKQTTMALAKSMSSWMNGGENVVLIIGGADGIHADLKQQANELWSLSDFTLPHGLARVVLMEQLYRAWSVIKKHPYHRE